MRRGLLVGVLALAFAVPAASAPPTISIQSNRRVVGPNQTFELSGAVASGKSGEVVVVETFECGGYGIWQSYWKVESGNGGTWVVPKAALGVTSDLRARWRGGVSNKITVKAHPYMLLRHAGPGRYDIGVGGNRFFEGTRGVVERLTGAKWVRVRAFTLHRAGDAGTAWSAVRVAVSVKPGTPLRAVIPKSQLGRCYLAGYSNTITA
ncbi:MAG: hypothetical protein WAQ33_05450 [Gaiellaceae bacterium]